MVAQKKKKILPKLLILLFLGIVLILIAGFFLGKEKITTYLTDSYVSKIDKELPSLHKFHVTVYAIPDVTTETDAYDKKGDVRKLSAEFFGNDFQVEREYYYDNGKLRFVHELTKSRNEQLQDYIKTEENWFYFDNDKMILWLSGSKKEKKTRDETYSVQEQDVILSSQDLLTGIAPKLAWKQRNPVPLSSFLPGKSFYHYCVTSTERGTFEPDGRLPTSEFDGFEYRESKIGKWQVDGEKLIIFDTALTAIDTFRDLLFEEKEGNIIGYHDKGTCSIEIAKDYETLKAFDKTRVWSEKNDSKKETHTDSMDLTPIVPE